MTTEQLDGGAVREVAGLATKASAVQQVTIGDTVFVDRPLIDPRKADPLPAAIVMATLASFAAFVAQDPDAEFSKGKPRFVHVVSPTKVELRTGVFDRFANRGLTATASVDRRPFGFGQWMDPETFNIQLRTAFQESEDRAAVMRLVGNICSEAVQSVLDDGISQRATVQAGIARRDTTDVPSTVHLKPWRTFTEVQQPDSPFVLRLRGGSQEKPPTCALFEMDGGAWTLKAVSAVKAWLDAEFAKLGCSISVFA